MSTEMSTQAQNEAHVVSFHIDADLYVCVNQQGPTYFKVHSALVAAASPVWRTQIYGGKYNRPAKGKWIIDMNNDDDSQYGLDIVFSIVHYKFHEIPTRPLIEELFGIAKIVSKYQCEHLVTPFMKGWVDGINYYVTMDDSQNKNDDEKTLFVSWVFGEARWFPKCLARVAYKATIDDGELVDSHGQKWTNSGFPTVITDLMKSARDQALAKILPAIETPFNKLLHEPKTKNFCRSFDASDEEFEQCQLLQLGSLMSGLTAANVRPVPEATSYHGSVYDLAKKLKSMKIVRFKFPGVKPHFDFHRSCGIQHEEAIDNAMPSSIAMDEQLTEELWRRSKKSGAFSTELFSEIIPMMNEDLVSSVDKELKQNATHYKQAEDFETAPDYYSERDADSVTEGKKDTVNHHKQDEKDETDLSEEGSDCTIIDDEDTSLSVVEEQDDVVEEKNAALIEKDAAPTEEKGVALTEEKDTASTEKDVALMEEKGAALTKENDSGPSEEGGAALMEEKDVVLTEENDAAVTEEKDIALTEEKGTALTEEKHGGEGCRLVTIEEKDVA